MSAFKFNCAVFLLLGSAGVIGGCSGSGGSSGSAGPPVSGQTGDLTVSSISLINNTTVALNRSIRMSFDREVDFSSVSNSTIQIQSSQGVPAVGSFSPLKIDTDGDGILETVDLSVVVWQPACPTLPDFSDAGLSNTGESYTLRLRGTDSGGSFVLRSADGRELVRSEVRHFFTPNSINPGVLFDDTVAGPPMVRVRSLGSTTQLGVSRVELGGDSDLDAQLYFERDNLAQESTVVPGSQVTGGVEVPLNLYADATQAVVFIVELNQPINPSQQNLSGGRLGLEYRLPSVGPLWTPIETALELVQNCSESGAQLRLTPVGILPPGALVRAVVRARFEGLVGIFDATQTDQDSFAVVTTRQSFDASLLDPTALADEIFESFDIGGRATGSLQDLDAILSVPTALWGGGQLQSNLNFPGDGGEGGNFDWVISQPLESFDTSLQTIIGGPNGARSLEQFTVGGIVNVRNFIIEAGTELQVRGPNPFVVNATGEIRIEGILRIDGGSARDVISLNTGAQPEPGGSGNLGGGDGGSTSRIRNNSTPRGDLGFGPFGSGPIGGQGGESGVGSNANIVSPENRRPGGGGGGRFNIDQDDLSATSELGLLEPSFGMQAGQGGNGHALSRGAESGQMPSQGGFPGMGPFLDARLDNNFLGRRAEVVVSIPMDGLPPVAGPQTGIIQGELTSIHAGYGGGGGGDALPANFFPTPNWTVSSDEKGGGGGGGAGAVQLRALGPIRFVGLGSLLSCKGGRGAIGESFIFVDRIGGTGGSGSGGHVILESGTRVSFELPPVAQRPASMPRHIFIDARGRRGRIGQPTDQNPGSGVLMIPQDVSFGGHGGPGLIQIHVPDAVTPPQEDIQITDIVLPVGTEAELDAGDANALHEVMRPAGVQLLSNFAGTSSTQTRWIDLRRTELNADGSTDMLRFLFKGIDPSTGSVRTTGGEVQELAPLLSGNLTPGSADIIGDDTLCISGAALAPLLLPGAPVSNDIYLRTPILMRSFVLRVGLPTGVALDFIVQDADYDGTAGALQLVVGQAAGLDLAAFGGQGGSVSYRLIPRFFSVSSAGVPKQIPSTSDLRIRFEGARADSNGEPDVSNLLVPFTSDPAAFAALNPGELDFLRIRFELNIDVPGTGISADTPTLALDFFRLPFLF